MAQQPRGFEGKTPAFFNNAVKPVDPVTGFKGNAPAFFTKTVPISSLNVFDNLLRQGSAAGLLPARTQEARDWYRAVASETTVKGAVLTPGQKNRWTNSVTVGSMYMFNYDAKHKDTLPYWDARPLIFPFRLVPGGFYGINVHYLPLPLRAALMDELYKTANNKRYDESTVLAVNYQLLMSSAKTNMIKPCVKHYLTPHVKSSFMYIHPEEWDIALFLPVASWQKGTPY